MSQQKGRSRGLALMVLGTLVFIGTNRELLPAAAFWPGLVACALGMIQFVKANRIATDVAERRAHRAVNPKLANPTGDRFAEHQSQSSGLALQDIGDRNRVVAPPTTPVSQQIVEDELVLYEVDNADANAGNQDFVISTDVSFPLEVQSESAIGDQLAKLERLREQGILNDEEFAVAKAKLLR